MNTYDKHQSGIALIMGLVMLLLLTIIMMAAVGVTVLEEKMASNLQNQNVAFQAAESALREAEARITGGTGPFKNLRLSGEADDESAAFRASSKGGCKHGFCTKVDPSEADVELQSEVFKNASSSMSAADFHDEMNSITANTGIDSIIAEPEYIFELVRIDPHTDSRMVYATFLITTRAWGEDVTSRAQLQSTYRLTTEFVR